MRSPANSRLNLLSIGLAIAGLAVAAYLTLVHYRDELLVCSVGGCETVQKSPYAEFMGIPVAILGLGLYIVVAALAILRQMRPERTENITLALFALALAGTVFTIYLTYLELFVIHAICQWCVLFAIVTWILTLVEGMRAWRSLQSPLLFEDDDELDASD